MEGLGSRVQGSRVLRSKGTLYGLGFRDSGEEVTLPSIVTANESI